MKNKQESTCKKASVVQFDVRSNNLETHSNDLVDVQTIYPE
jgi:hypothetical protein